MATLSKHGNYIIIEYVWRKKAYCEDGSVLLNYGDGWKTYRRLKAGLNWQEVANQKIVSRDSLYRKCPSLKKLVEVVSEVIGGYKNRSLVKVALTLLARDPDGLWSELQDAGRYGNGPDLSLDDCVKLCEAYLAALAELRELNGVSND